MRKFQSRQFLSSGFLSAGLIFSLLSSPLYSSAMAEDLSTAMQWTFENNADIQAGFAGLDATKEGIAIAGSARLPQINLSASYAHSEQEIAGFPEWVESERLSATVSASLLLYDGGQSALAVESAKTQWAAQANQMRSTAQQILFSTISTYIEILRLNQLLNMDISNVKLLETRVDSAQIAYDTGSATAGDFAQTEAAYAQAQAAVVSRRASLKAAQAKYRELTGHDAGALDNISSPSLPSSMEAAIGYAQSHSPMMKASILFEQAAQYDLRRAKAGGMPQLTASISSTQSHDYYADSTTGNVSANLNLQMPLYTGGRLSALSRQAESLLTSRMKQTDQMRTALRANITSAWASWQQARDYIQTMNAVVDAQKVTDEAAEIEYDLGAITVVERLESEQALIAARSNALTAQYNEKLAAYNVLLSMGILGLEILGEHAPTAEDYKRHVPNPASDTPSAEATTVQKLQSRWGN